MLSFDLFEGRKSIRIATIRDARLEIGRRNTEHWRPRERITARSMTFCISRMFPGQGYRTNAFIVSEEIVSICFFMLRAKCWAKCRTRKGMSSVRSIKDGTWIGNTFNL
jgi:hypothetical protein